MTVTSVERYWRRPWVRIVGIYRKETQFFDLRLQIALIVSRLLPPLVGNTVRASLLRWGGVSIGRGTVFGGPTIVVGFFGATGLRIGRDCIINGRTFFDVTEHIELGDRTALGQDVMILTSSHQVGDATCRCGEQFERPVSIGPGAWVAARAVILPGVTIGAGAVVATGAVVTKDVPPNTLVAGVPARVIKHLDAEGNTVLVPVT